MELKFAKYRIELFHSFKISRSQNNWYDIVYIYLIDNDIIGRGEAAPSIRYNESFNQIFTLLKKIVLPKQIIDMDSLYQFILPQLRGIKSLEAGFNMAILDWWGQKTNKTVSSLLDVSRSLIPSTSFTIGISNLNDIGAKIEEAKSYKILKVKLGTENIDKEIITEIRRYTDKLIRVDANEGWSIDNALNLSFWLADRNVEFIEQPFPANELKNTAILKKKSPLDIYADENSINSLNIPIIKDSFDGINIKLMKCGSLEEGIKMIFLAKKYKLKIMLGCMVESSVGITAASQIASLADKIDLDGNLLIKNDPYNGVMINNGNLTLLEKSGMGLSLKNNIKGLY